MSRMMWITFPLAFGLLAVSAGMAQTSGGDATFISAKDIATLMKDKAPPPAAAGKVPGASDIAMKMLSSGAVNVGASVLQYPKGSRLVDGVVQTTSHSDTPEVYYVLKGSGTILTGGSIEKTREANSVLTGPSVFGPPRNAVAHKIGPGDVIIVPPNMPHVVSEVTEDLAFLIIRVDTKKQLKAE